MGAWVIAVSLSPVQADSTLPDGHLGDRPVILVNHFGGDGTMDIDEPDEEEDQARAIHG
jgi:hypothetical protein